MQLRVRTWRHIFVYSSFITTLAVTVPLVTVSIALWQVPLMFKLPILAIAGVIPLFIAFPVSVFALYILKLVYGTVDALDAYVKFDHLTGLLTRGYFLSSAELQRSKGGFFLLFDADRFKSINDTYGHDQGDEVLKYLSRNLLQATGNSGICGRLGGEEFAVYLPGAGKEQARLLAAGIGAALRGQTIDLEGTPVTVTVSIGIAEDRLGDSLAQVMKRADLCLYAAKHGGRDRFVFDNPEDERAISVSAVA